MLCIDGGADFQKSVVPIRSDQMRYEAMHRIKIVGNSFAMILSFIEVSLVVTSVSKINVTILREMLPDASG